MGAEETRVRDYRLDREVPGYGRVRLSTEARSDAEHRARLALFDTMLHEGMHDTLRVFLNQELTWGDLLHAQRTGTLATAASTLVLRKNLWATVHASFQGKPDSHPQWRTEHRYLSSFKQLEASQTLRKTATVEELASVDWKALERSWGGSAADWNHLRAAVRRLLSVVSYRGSSFWRERLAPRFPTRKKVVRAVRAPLEVLVKLLEASPADVRVHVLALIATGMRPIEYTRFNESWLEPSYVLHIWGTKNATSDRSVFVDPRLWPTLEQAARVAKGETWKKVLAGEIRKSCLAIGIRALQVRDLRHVHRQLCGEAGIPSGAAEFEMGHAVTTIEGIYSRNPWEMAHAKRFADYISPLLPKDPTITPMRRQG